ncbi:hypothetical protein BJ508DRAFT_158119 [Ascobolus immersus RN42]|uniref:Uncharacterized protein n=1 Tax=Ascobolus immersus RN42 TaxID=1160509 RepID=A0A3N4IJD4_ASCIM|nr:hypothetical protein BJ508DRAFT_158119 [Ascobolus immersus RN42]
MAKFGTACLNESEESLSGDVRHSILAGTEPLAHCTPFLVTQYKDSSLTNPLGNEFWFGKLWTIPLFVHQAPLYPLQDKCRCLEVCAPCYSLPLQHIRMLNDLSRLRAVTVDNAVLVGRRPVVLFTHLTFGRNPIWLSFWLRVGRRGTSIHSPQYKVIDCMGFDV